MAGSFGIAGGLVVAGLLPGMGSLTKLDVGNNRLGDESATAICDALRESEACMVQQLDLSYNEIGPDGAKAIAALLAASNINRSRSIGDSLTHLL